MSTWAYSTAGFERIIHRIDGIETVTYAIGDGPPLVYLHGGGTFHGFEWTRPLARDFRVFCPYHPNFGESADAPFASIGDYVAHYASLIEALQLDTFHLAGASMGGHMAASYAAVHPGAIDRLALVAPPGLVSERAVIPNFLEIPPGELSSLFVSDPAWIAPFWPAEPSPEWKAMRRREFAATLAAREDLSATDRDLRAGLKGFDRPTLLLWGDADRIVPLGFAQDWQEVLPHAELEVIRGGSHLLLDEFPAAAEALRQFLAA